MLHVSCCTFVLLRSFRETKDTLRVYMQLGVLPGAPFHKLLVSYFLWALAL